MVVSMVTARMLAVSVRAESRPHEVEECANNLKKDTNPFRRRRTPPTYLYRANFSF